MGLYTQSVCHTVTSSLLLLVDAVHNPATAIHRKADLPLLKDIRLN